MKVHTHLLFVLITATSILSLPSAGKNNYQRSAKDTDVSRKHPHHHTHIVTKNGETFTIHINRQKIEKSEGKEIISKEVRKEGKLIELYTKGHMGHSWKKVPIGCLKNQRPKTQERKTENCANGWAIGKIIARTITYLALHHGQSELGKVNVPGLEAHSSKRAIGGRTNGANDFEEVAENIRNVVKKTAGCIKEGLALSGITVKEVCIQKAMVKEAKELIQKILSSAAKNGFKCSYEALKQGKCTLVNDKEEIKKGIRLINSLRSF